MELERKAGWGGAIDCVKVVGGKSGMGCSNTWPNVGGGSLKVYWLWLTECAIEALVALDISELGELASRRDCGESAATDCLTEPSLAGR